MQAFSLERMELIRGQQERQICCTKCIKNRKQGQDEVIGGLKRDKV
jgi:hypothetical protein